MFNIHQTKDHLDVSTNILQLPLRQLPSPLTQLPLPLTPLLLLPCYRELCCLRVAGVYIPSTLFYQRCLLKRNLKLQKPPPAKTVGHVWQTDRGLKQSNVATPSLMFTTMMLGCPDSSLQEFGKDATQLPSKKTDRHFFFKAADTERQEAGYPQRTHHCLHPRLKCIHLSRMNKKWKRHKSLFVFGKKNYPASKPSIP